MEIENGNAPEPSNISLELIVVGGERGIEVMVELCSIGNSSKI